MRNLQVAAAVARAIGGHSAAQAAPATPAQCAAAGATLYVAGSSAAQPSFATALAADLFDTNGETTIAATGGDGHFQGHRGFAQAGYGAGGATRTTATVDLRRQGGSVVGGLPVGPNTPLQRPGPS